MGHRGPLGPPQVITRPENLVFGTERCVSQAHASPAASVHSYTRKAYQRTNLEVAKVHCIESPSILQLLVGHAWLSFQLEKFKAGTGTGNKVTRMLYTFYALSRTAPRRMTRCQSVWWECKRTTYGAGVRCTGSRSEKVQVLPGACSELCPTVAHSGPTAGPHSEGV